MAVTIHVIGLISGTTNYLLSVVQETFCLLHGEGRIGTSLYNYSLLLLNKTVAGYGQAAELIPQVQL